LPLLMVFIDGFGLGAAEQRINPFSVAEMPFVREVLSGHPLTGEIVKTTGLSGPGWVIKPTGTTLEMGGIPQSATGQTVLFSGVNAAQLMGRHVGGFPTKSLQAVLNHQNIFKRINQSGLKAVFANAFTEEYFEAVNRRAWMHSVTTTAALAGDCRLLMVSDLLAGEAVYQDITNEQLRERGYQLPLSGPEEAGTNLAKLAAKNDFTLFEYFQTDMCGHKQDWDLALILLNRLDRFLGTIFQKLKTYDLQLLVVSDHGNIEDLSTHSHTFNDVPTMAFGNKSEVFGDVVSLLDIYPALLRFFGLSEQKD
jgi:2,3-bisphosphoglycerate-independent phosphoglycerate mutase